MAFPRQPAEEWLDSPDASAAEVTSALRSLAFVNRFFGGSRTHRLLLAHAARGRRQLSVLEVASGRATALASAAKWLGRNGVSVRTTLLDRHASHLPTAWPAELPAPRLVTADALALPFPDADVDIVSCCLFLHHLTAAQAAQFLREALRVARLAVLINDLERTRLHHLLARAFALVDPSRLSRHDGPVSVGQAWSTREMHALLQATGAPYILHRRFLFRHAVILWRVPAAELHP